MATRTPRGSEAVHSPHVRFLTRHYCNPLQPRPRLSMQSSSQLISRSSPRGTSPWRHTPAPKPPKPPTAMTPRPNPSWPKPACYPLLAEARPARPHRSCIGKRPTKLGCLDGEPCHSTPARRPTVKGTAKGERRGQTGSPTVEAGRTTVGTDLESGKIPSQSASLILCSVRGMLGVLDNLNPPKPQLHSLYSPQRLPPPHYTQPHAHSGTDHPLLDSMTLTIP